jgi:hypothetical protein
LGHPRPLDRLSRTGRSHLDRQSRAVALFIVVVVIGSLVFGTLLAIFAPPAQ